MCVLARSVSLATSPERYRLQRSLGLPGLIPRTAGSSRRPLADSEVSSVPGSRKLRVNRAQGRGAQEPRGACAGRVPGPGLSGSAPRGWVASAPLAWRAIRATQSARRRTPGGPTINTRLPPAARGFAHRLSGKEALGQF